jgi:hypothetical protein
MARPQEPVSAFQATKLASLGLTVIEIADFLEVDRATLYRCFATEISKGHGLLNIKLRRLQLKAAKRGNVAMLIFLGKAILGQREIHEQEKIPQNVNIIFAERPDDLVEAHAPSKLDLAEE